MKNLILVLATLLPLSAIAQEPMKISNPVKIEKMLTSEIIPHISGCFRSLLDSDSFKLKIALGKTLRGVVLTKTEIKDPQSGDPTYRFESLHGDRMERVTFIYCSWGISSSEVEAMDLFIDNPSR